MERGLRFDEKKSFISGGFVVYLLQLMLRAKTINWNLLISLHRYNYSLSATHHVFSKAKFLVKLPPSK